MFVAWLWLRGSVFVARLVATRLSVCSAAVASWLSVCSVAVASWLSVCSVAVASWLSVCSVAVASWLSVCNAAVASAALPSDPVDFEGRRCESPLDERDVPASVPSLVGSATSECSVTRLNPASMYRI